MTAASSFAELTDDEVEVLDSLDAFVRVVVAKQFGEAEASDGKVASRWKSAPDRSEAALVTT